MPCATAPLPTPPPPPSPGNEPTRPYPPAGHGQREDPRFRHPHPGDSSAEGREAQEESGEAAPSGCEAGQMLQKQTGVRSVLMRPRLCLCGRVCAGGWPVSVAPTPPLPPASCPQPSASPLNQETLCLPGSASDCPQLPLARPPYCCDVCISVGDLTAPRVLTRLGEKMC